MDNSSIGVDLALYKAPEPKSSNDSYEVWLLVASSANDSDVKVALKTTIYSSCNGWQMFHLDNSVMSPFVQANKANIELLVYKNDDEWSFPCDKVHSLFIFNTTAHQSNQKSKDLLPTPIPANTTYPLPTPYKSITSNPFGKTEEQLQYFTPVLNVFQQRKAKKRWTKREAQTRAMKPVNTISLQEPCQLLDNWVKVNSTYWVNGEAYSVKVPQFYNAKKCVSKKGYHGTCAPTGEKPLVIVLETNQGKMKRAFKKTFMELKITEKCG